jgi:hypothetical protein
METTFARWLRERGEGHYAYAVRRRLGKISVALLAGVGREPREVTRLNYTALQRINEDSGIPIQTLIDEAAAAAKNPVEPRKYVKRNGEERADA